MNCRLFLLFLTTLVSSKYVLSAEILNGQSAKDGQRNRQLWINVTTKLTGLRLAKPNEQLQLVVFFDPNCPACATLWQWFDSTPKRNIASLWVPVSYMGKSSLGRSVALLRHENSYAALAKNYGDFDRTQRMGAITPADDITLQEQANFLSVNEPIKVNSGGVNEFGVWGKGSVIEVSNLNGLRKYLLSSYNLNNTVIKNKFYVNLCDKQLLGIVFKSDEQYEHMIVENYFIYLINIKDGSLIGEFYKVERKNDNTGKVIDSDNTDNFITALKSGGNPDYGSDLDLPNCSHFELGYKPHLTKKKIIKPLCF